MLTSHIETQIYNFFEFEPTFQQKNIISSLSNFIVFGQTRSIFMINGYAGTGKTSLLAAVVKALKSMGLQTVLMAPTGRAAKVMSTYCDGAPAFTIHKKIYRRGQISAENSLFNLNINKDNNAIFIVDEASMLSNFSSDRTPFGSGRLMDDLVEFVETGSDNRLIVVGDDAQLPPIGLDFSPALNPLEMGRYGRVDYHIMTEVVRQTADSGILTNATALRRQIEDQNIELPRMVESADVVRVSGMELIESIESSYSRYGRDQTIVITRSNKRANQYNQGIRRSILDFEDEIQAGDMVMVVKNNYFYTERDKSTAIDFIANGDVAKVRRVTKISEFYGFRFAYCTLTFGDYDDYTLDCWVMLDTLNSEAPSLSRADQTRLFYAVEQDYIDIRNKQQRYGRILENEFFNALQIKFSYAVTCHKAQGGQWAEIYLDQMLFAEEPMTRDFQRWLYTAVTRATHRLHLVNWDDRFFL